MSDGESGKLEVWRRHVGESFLMLMKGGWELGEVEESGWSAMAGTNVMGANRFLLYGKDEALKKKYEEKVLSKALLASMMMAGEEAKSMPVDKSVWHELPDTPLMSYDLLRDRASGVEGRCGQLRLDPRVYLAKGSDYLRVVKVLKDAFEVAQEQIVPSPFAICAKNIDEFHPDDMKLFVIDDDQGDIASIVYGVKVGPNQVLLAMGTTPHTRRKGYGAAVLHAALLDAKNMGLHYSLLFASDLGKKLYDACGFDTAEWWSFYRHKPLQQ